MMHEHTFHYTDQADFITQLDTMLTKLIRSEMTPYYEVRARYPHLSASTFTMRLKRFKGEFPHEMGPKGRKILKLAVTRELDAYLRK